jgi:hypothetical protein
LNVFVRFAEVHYLYNTNSLYAAYNCGNTSAECIPKGCAPLEDRQTRLVSTLRPIFYIHIFEIN